jgi:hypothetical protein
MRGGGWKEPLAAICDRVVLIWNSGNQERERGKRAIVPE